MIELLNPYVPPYIDQDMIWIADYTNNTYLSEFDLQTSVENNFYSIDKDKLSKFGLIGLGYNCYFDIFGGIFYINNKKISIRLLTTDYIYNLTEQNLMYNDIITYKSATAKVNFNMNERDSTFVRSAESTVDSFHVGYKSRFNINGVNFNFQVIGCFPYVETPYFNIKIVSDQNLQGNLVLMVDESTSLNMEANLKENYGGEINWRIAL